MQKQFILTVLLFFCLLACKAQKKNYIAFEDGSYFGNTNSNIASNMTASGFADKSVVDFFGLVFTTQYPVKRNDKSSYRIRAGHYLDAKTAIEAGFGLAYHGEVQGYDERYPSGSNYLTLTSHIHTFYIAWIKTDERRIGGGGAGPSFSLYKLTADANHGNAESAKSYFLPGIMVTGFWNFVHRPSWFLGLRTDLSVTAPAKINEIKVTSPYDASSVSTFKTVKAGSFNGCINLGGGFRF